MATKRFVIDGFGQVELNNVAFRRDGRIEAQCALDETDFASIPAENGMLLAIDRLTRKVSLPAGNGTELIGLHYSAEHIYDERTPGLKNFKLELGEFYPRLGYLAVGDKWTENCISYKDTEFADDDALIAALEALDASHQLYGGVDPDFGAVLLSATKPTNGPVLRVVEYTTMPDGTPGVMLQVMSC